MQLREAERLRPKLADWVKGQWVPKGELTLRNTTEMKKNLELLSLL